MNQPGGARARRGRRAPAWAGLVTLESSQIRGPDPLPLALTLTKSQRGASLLRMRTHRSLGWRLRSSRIPATQPPNSGPEPTLPASQPGPAVLAVMGNRDVATVATFPPNGETAGCGPACPHSLKGDPHGTQQQPLSRGVRRLPARTPCSRARGAFLTRCHGNRRPSTPYVQNARVSHCSRFRSHQRLGISQSKDLTLPLMSPPPPVTFTRLS